MIRPKLSLLIALGALTWPAAVVADDAKKGDDKKDPYVGEDGVRRDPKGVKGISPFWESVKKGDTAYVSRSFDSAIAAYKEALSHEPQNPMGHYRLGEAQLAKGNLDEAEASWETAKRFAGSNEALRSKALFVLADLAERKRAMPVAKKGWNGYSAHAETNMSVKTYPETPPERQKRIDTWVKMEEDYKAVKERIKKRLEELDAKKK